MTIAFTTLFTRLGKFMSAGNSVQTALGTTVPGKVDTALQGLGSALTTDYEIVRENIRQGLVGFQSAGNSAMAALVQTPAQQLTRLTVRDDAPINDTVSLALLELIRQMEDNSESLDGSTPSGSVAYHGDNVGTGIVMLSVKRADGRLAEFIYGEEIDAEVTAVAVGVASLTLTGEPLLSTLSPLWPGGSGIATGVASRTSAGAANIIGNGGFETENELEADLPDGWLAPVGTLGTTLKLTNVEEQTIVITGPPTAGYYILHWVNAAGDSQSTVPLPYDATESEVLEALTALIGLGEITVETTGTSPNYTHTVTFIGVTNPATISSTNATTGGTLTHNVTEAGSANVLRGARAIEFDSDGSQLTTIMYPVALAPLTQHAVHLFAKVDVVPAGGVMTVDLVDGVGGTVIADEQATANSFTFNATALTTAWAAQSGFFRTPRNMPTTAYLRIRISTAVTNTTSVYIDEVCMGLADELYTDGPSIAVVEGETAWLTADRATLTIANDRAGAIHEWLDRIFSLRESRLLFPTDFAGGETQLDSLIPA